VDQEFEKLMSMIFGKDLMDDFKMKRPAGYVDLMIAFEARKRTASPFKNNSLNISLPFSFIDFYKKKKVITKEKHLKIFERSDFRARRLNQHFVVLMIQISNGQHKE
jgi:hypothetical protein